MKYLVATDGACKGNPGPGTWAFCVFDTQGNYVGHKKGHNPKTTNNEQELTAILEVLRWSTPHKLSIKILTDSAYCMNGIVSWRHGWAKKGWRSSTGKEVANLVLWKEVHSLWNDELHKIEKVKGHSGNKYNDMADMFCNEEYLNTFI